MDSNLQGARSTGRPEKPEKRTVVEEEKICSKMWGKV
jgi:hypothetical protein